MSSSNSRRVATLCRSGERKGRQSRSGAVLGSRESVGEAKKDHKSSSRVLHLEKILMVVGMYSKKIVFEM